MPPKRASTKKDESSKKKPKKEVDPLQEKINPIVEAIETHHENLEMQELLVQAAKTVFNEPKDKRHRFHDELIKMIDTSLREYIKTFEDKTEDMNVKVNSADEKKAENISNRDRINEDLEKKTELINAKQLEVKEKEDTVKQATKEVKDKRAEKKKACGPLISLEDDLEECGKHNTSYTEIRDKAAEMSKEKRKKSIKQLETYLKTILDGSLIISAIAVLDKEVKAGFDLQVLSAIEAQFAETRSQLEAKIKAEKESNVQIISEVEAAEANLQSAKEAAEAARTELENLENERKGLEKEKKTLDKDIKDHDKNVKTHVSDLQGFRETLESLSKVYDTMSELRDRQSHAEKAEVSPEDDETTRVSARQTFERSQTTPQFF